MAKFADGFRRVGAMQLIIACWLLIPGRQFGELGRTLLVSFRQ